MYTMDNRNLKDLLYEQVARVGKALANPKRLASMYRTVLNEAKSIDDLRAWIDGRLLVGMWPNLWLPPQVRRLWESRFPELASLRAAAAF